MSGAHPEKNENNAIHDTNHKLPRIALDFGSATPGTSDLLPIQHAYHEGETSPQFCVPFQKQSLSLGSRAGWDSRFRRMRKRVFMDLTARWTGDPGVQFHLFFVLVGHPF